eukprot:5898884-Heterocapsa_arctica.AAC.1
MFFLEPYVEDALPGEADAQQRPGEADTLPGEAGDQQLPGEADALPGEAGAEEKQLEEEMSDEEIYELLAEEGREDRRQ